MTENPLLAAVPTLHLAAEAIVAYLDGELAPGPRQRASAHLSECFECHIALVIQQQSKQTLAAAFTPPPTDDLLTRLHNIPTDTDLGRPEITLAVNGTDVQWGRARPPRKTRSRKRPQADRPGNRDNIAHLWRPGIRSGLVGVAAAVMVGMLAATSPASGGGAATNLPSAPRQASGQSGTIDVSNPSLTNVARAQSLLTGPEPIADRTHLAHFMGARP